MQAAAVVVVKALQCKIISYKILKPFDLSEGFCFLVNPSLAVAAAEEEV